MRCARLYLDFFQLCSRGCQPAGFPGVWSAPVCAASPQLRAEDGMRWLIIKILTRWQQECHFDYFWLVFRKLLINCLKSNLCLNSTKTIGTHWPQIFNFALFEIRLATGWWSEWVNMWVNMSGWRPRRSATWSLAYNMQGGGRGGGGAALGKDQILEKQKTCSWPGTKFCKSSKARQWT